MRKLAEFLNESLQIINEDWGAIYKDYAKELTSIFARYEKGKAKYEKAPGRFGPSEKYIEVLAKYPMQILINKAGYTPKEVTTWGPGGKKTGPNKIHYGQFLIGEIESGNITKEQLIEWWREYDNEVMRAKWHDPSFIVKQIDPTRMWNPFDPTDERIIQMIIDSPQKIIGYLKGGNGLRYNERQELIAFLSDPTQQDALREAFKKAKNTISKVRPTFKKAAMAIIQGIIENCDYSEGDVSRLLAREYAENSRGYSEGGNSRSHYGSAAVKVILETLNKMYGFSVWNSINGNDDGDVQIEFYTHGELEDSGYQKFVEEGRHLHFTVTDKGERSKSTSGVWSSSFSESYYHNFEVVVTKDGEEIYRGTVNDVTVGSYFYSGGWN